jgi:hypothetical protein
MSCLPQSESNENKIFMKSAQLLALYFLPVQH